MFESDEDNIYIKRLKLKIMSMSPYDFECYITQLFKRLGYNALQTPPTNDGGKDIILEYALRKYYVECKHFSIGNFIGREILQKAVGAAVVDGNVDACIIVTTSLFNHNFLDIVGNSNSMPVFLLDLDDIVLLSTLTPGRDIFKKEVPKNMAVETNYGTPTSSAYGYANSYDDANTTRYYIPETYQKANHRTFYSKGKNWASKKW